MPLSESNVTSVFEDEELRPLTPHPLPQKFTQAAERERQRGVHTHATATEVEVDIRIRLLLL